MDLNERIKAAVNEKLCKKGEAYRKRRMAAGEKSSAYLSGRAVKVCKGQMSGKKKKKIVTQDQLTESIQESLRDWFKKEDWVRINTSGNISGKCGTMKKGKATTRCLPKKKAQSLTKAERKATVAKKVRGDKKGKQFVKNTKKAEYKKNKQMKKSILLLLVSMFLIVGCKNKKAEKVETSPAKFTLTVINHTDQDMKWEQSWAMTGPDSGVVAAGDTVELSSNEVDSDHINVYPMPPKSIDQPNPGNGTFNMQYGWDGHIARVYCDNVCNKGYPTADIHYDGTNWIYATEWLKDPSVQTNTTNTVTITTKPWSNED